MYKAEVRNFSMSFQCAVARKMRTASCCAAMEEIDQISWDIIFSGAQLVYEVVIAVDFFQVLQIFVKSTADYPDL